ncbi:conserved exported hypothetical protein [Rhodospirillaceae bacterium LM-1]|nr:conserved exported hypothetical protein [Rhodospirillaceae bacterium LM-1]
MKTDLSRRDLLALCLGAAGTAFLPRNALASPAWDRTLIMIEFNGGNDGLNTVVPYDEPLYAQLRPKLAIPRAKVLHLDHELGLHPALEPLMPLWKQNEVAVALGLGYPKPNRSHFRSIEIWESASDSDAVEDQGWVAALLPEARLPKAGTPAIPAHALVMGNGSSGPFEGGQLAVVTLDRKGQGPRQQGKERKGGESMDNPALDHILAVRTMNMRAAQQIVPERLAQVKMQAGFPQGAFGSAMENAARLLLAGIMPPVIKLSLGSFDTHANQLATHEKLLGEFAQALAALRSALDKAGLWDRVLVMTYSEFGRRAKENASQGTDHGTAAPHFLVGGQVKGGLYGAQPPLSQAKDNDLVFTTDFRSYYNAIAEHWWRVPGIPGFKPLSGPLG